MRGVCGAFEGLAAVEASALKVRLANLALMFAPRSAIQCGPGQTSPDLQARLPSDSAGRVFWLSHPRLQSDSTRRPSGCCCLHSRLYHRKAKLAVSGSPLSCSRADTEAGCAREVDRGLEGRYVAVRPHIPADRADFVPGCRPRLVGHWCRNIHMLEGS